MKVQMKLLSDVIFGNGESIPGAEDISILVDDRGFPYYKGGTFKGIFREELKRYLELTSKENEIKSTVSKLLGNSGDDANSEFKLTFSDFTISENVKSIVFNELNGNKADILSTFTNLRTFTKISDKGVVEKGTLRVARCVNKGLILYSDIDVPEDNEIKTLVKNVLGMIKYVGTDRNRGFGSVEIKEEV